MFLFDMFDFLLVCISHESDAGVAKEGFDVVLLHFVSLDAPGRHSSEGAQVAVNSVSLGRLTSIS